MDEVQRRLRPHAGRSHAKLSADLPVITAEETDALRFGTRKTGKVRQTLHLRRT